MGKVNLILLCFLLIGDLSRFTNPLTKLLPKFPTSTNAYLQQKTEKRAANDSQFPEDYLPGSIEHPNTTDAGTRYNKSFMVASLNHYFNIFPEMTNDLTDINYDHSNEIYEILNDTRHLCPFSSYCGSEPLLKIKIPGYISCCGQCSCDMECGRRGDCCHRDLDLYKLKDKYDMKCVAVKWKLSKHPMSASYYMVDKCLTSNSSCFDSDSNWIGLHPAFSPSTKLIFYNEECASCNDINDTVNWTSFLSCNGDVSLLSTPASLAKGFQTGECGFDFVPPPGMPEKHMRCFDSMIDSCEGGENGWHYRTHTSTACQALYSPFQNRKQIFANILCWFCNNKTYDYAGMCSPEKGRSPESSLSILIDYESLGHILDITKTKESAMKESVSLCPEHFIKHPYKNECLEVFCPYGQYRLGKDCHKVSKRWYVWGVVFAHLLITPQKAILEEDLTGGKGVEIEDFLKRNRLYWNHAEILYSKNETNNVIAVNSIMVLLAKETRTTKINLADIIGSIDKVLNVDLAIRIRDTTYRIKVNIDKGFGNRNDLDSVTIIKRATKHRDAPFNEKFYPLSGHRWLKPSALFPYYITTLFFCPFVKMQNSDFEKSDGGFSIFPNETSNRFVFATDMREDAFDGAYVCVTEIVNPKLAEKNHRKVQKAESGLIFVLVLVIVASMF